MFKWFRKRVDERVSLHDDRDLEAFLGVLGLDDCTPAQIDDLLFIALAEASGSTSLALSSGAFARLSDRPLRR